MSDNGSHGCRTARRSPGPLRRTRLAIAALSALAVAGAGHATAATDLVGTWRGDGTAVAADGGSHTVRCLISFHERKDGAFGFDGRCSTLAETASGSGRLTFRGRDRFSGTVTGLSAGTSGRIVVEAAAADEIAVAVTGNEGRLDVTMRKTTPVAD